MFYRNVTKYSVVALVAAILFGNGGDCVVGQNSSTVWSAPSNDTIVSYPQGSVVYPRSTLATGTIISSPTVTSAPVGTTTSMPATSYAPTATTYGAQPSVVQPSYSAAGTTYYSAPRPTPVRSTLSTGYRMVGNGVNAVSSGLAQAKAQRAASGMIRGHIGGSLGGARYEGVGWSSRSAQSAIEQCCYWGQRPVAQIGVSRGRDGLWYACVLYN